MRGSWWLGLVAIVAGRLLFACGSDNAVPCTSGPSCQQESAAGEGGDQNGAAGSAEAGAQSAGAIGGMNAAGEAGQLWLGGNEGGAGGEGPFIDACDADCVTASEAPWIVYAKDKFVYAVKSDLIGKMKPMRLTPPLAAPNDFEVIGNWSPDRKSVLVTTGYTEIHADAGFEVPGPTYLVELGGDLPNALTLNGDPAFRSFSWSPSGKHLFCESGSILYDWDIAKNTQTPVVELGPGTSFWVKNDAQLLLLNRVYPPKQNDLLWLARKGNAWAPLPLSDLGGDFERLTVNQALTQVTYQTKDSVSGSHTLWALQLVEGAQPKKVAGPAPLVEFRLSPDETQYLLAVADSVGNETTLFGGALSTLSSPPLLEQHLTIETGWVLPEAPWSPSSVYATVFDAGSNFYSKQLVIYEPGAAQPLRPIAITLPIQQVPIWSPNSKELVTVAQASSASNQTLYVIDPADGSKHDLGTASASGSYYNLQFSSGGEFLAFGRAPGVVGQGTFGFVDVRLGPASLGSPGEVSGGIDRAAFGTGTGLVFWSFGGGCGFVDLTSTIASQRIDPSSGAGLCVLQ